MTQNSCYLLVAVIFVGCSEFSSQEIMQLVSVAIVTTEKELPHSELLALLELLCYCWNVGSVE